MAESNHNDVFIVSACRTAIGHLGGQFANISAEILGGTVINHAMMRCDMTFKDINCIYMGHGIASDRVADEAQNSLLKPFISRSVPYISVGLFEGASMLAIQAAYKKIVHAPPTDPLSIVCGGQDNATLGNTSIIKKYFESKKLPIPMVDSQYYTYNGEILQVNPPDKIRMRCNYPINFVDQIVYESRRRAYESQMYGTFDNEIVPIYTNQYNHVLRSDEYVNLLKYDTTLSLAHAINPQVYSSGYTSLQGDGAAALVLCNSAALNKKSAKPLGRIINMVEVQNLEPKIDAVILAVTTLLELIKWPWDTIDLFEVSEDYATYVVEFLDSFGVHNIRVNTNGGAFGLGNPIAASSARMVTTLLTSLNKLRRKRGLIIQTIGNGTFAVAVERYTI